MCGLAEYYMLYNHLRSNNINELNIIRLHLKANTTGLYKLMNGGRGSFFIGVWEGSWFVNGSQNDPGISIELPLLWRVWGGGLNVCPNWCTSLVTLCI